MTVGATKMSDLDAEDTSTDLYISAGCTGALLAYDSSEATSSSSFRTVWSIAKFMHSRHLLAKQKAC